MQTTAAFRIRALCICLVFVVLKVAKDVKRIKGHMSLPMMYETVVSAWNMLSVLAAAGMKKKVTQPFFLLSDDDDKPPSLVC